MASIFTAMIFAASFALFFRASKSHACMTVLVGRKASATGEVLIAHNEDAPGRFTMQTHIVRKLRRHPGAKAKFEPHTAELELPETRTNLFWSEAKTYNPDTPGPSFCDLYVNGYGVVICTNNCEYSREDSPELTDGGIGYGLRRIVAESAHTAREAVDIAAGLIERYGYASSGRSYSFADKEDIYVMQIVHGKHYAVQRVPDDEVAVIPNHYTIHEPDRKAPGYNDLISYAIKRGWYHPEDGDFDFKRAYQAERSYAEDKNTHRHVRALQILLGIDFSGLLEKEWEPLPFSVKPARKIDIATLKKILRTHFEGTSSYTAGNDSPHFQKPLTVCNIDTLESTIIQIRHNPDRTIIRKALGRPCFAPYTAWYFGIPSVPEGYEDKDPETSLAEHFATTPDDMDYRNNAWYRAMEIQAACDILYDGKAEYVHAKIHELEEDLERKFAPLDSQIELRLRSTPDIARAMMEGVVMTQAEEVEKFMKAMKDELGIITCEAITNAEKGISFRVRFPAGTLNANELDISRCKCGPSYAERGKWSECLSVNEEGGFTVMEFSGGQWMNDAVPCFMDLYIAFTDNNGKKYAGCVKMRVRC
ncbi:MAG: C69 family dipeptidase [Synergistaceae bacterium]|nr:C69 family dipeptidase [Synergistaceae bacterium]